MPAKLGDPLGFEKLTVSNTAKALTLATYQTTPIANTTQRAILAVITVEDNDMRYRVDGTDPTTAIGHLIKDGGIIQLESGLEINQFRAIRVSADAVIQVTYYGVPSRE